MLNAGIDCGMLIHTLELLRFYYDIGIFDEITSGAVDIDGDDYYEFELLGLDCIAPMVERRDAEDMEDTEPDENEYFTHGGCGHSVYYYSSPEMREYYSLCRLYEHREDTMPEENPFVRAADDHYIQLIRQTSSYFGVGFDNERYTRNLVIELCPDNPYEVREILELVHNMLGYYTHNVTTLRLNIILGKPVCLPRLPAPKTRKRGKRK